MELTDRVALVTGGSRGIGRAVCERLAAMGAIVVVGYHRQQQTAEEVARRLKEATGIAAGTCALDLADQQQVTAAVNQVVAAHGRIDVLVNNAAIGIEGAVLPTSPAADWTAVVQTNLIGSFHCLKAASIHMLLARRGSIVNVASIAALIGIEGLSAYAASKAGLLGLTRSVAKEFAAHGVRVNAVAPGYTAETGMIERVGAERQRRLLERIPMRRLARPGEIAEVIAFLASDRSSYVTGQTFVVDGGLSA